MVDRFDDLKNEIESEFSNMEEVGGVFKPVKFNSIFSHDIVIKKQIEKCILPSELYKKETIKKQEDNRFLSKRMREIMFLPVVKQ